MATRLTLRKVGGSLATTIPKELADRFSLKEGDQLFAVETGDGLLLTPYDPDFADAMEAFEAGRRKYRNTLRKLAE
jgi:antitoxin MazE